MRLVLVSAVLLLVVALMLENDWLSTRTVFVLALLVAAFVFLAVVVQQCRSTTQGLLEAVRHCLQSRQVRGNGPFGTTLTIAPSRPHSPDSPDTSSTRVFVDNGVVITSSDESSSLTTVLESGTVIRWTNTESCSRLLGELFDSVAPSEKSQKKWRRHIKQMQKQLGIELVSSDNYATVVTKDNLAEVMEVLGQILQPYCRGMDLKPVLNHCLEKLQHGLTLDRVFAHRMTVMSTANDTDLLWLMYHIKVRCLKSGVRAFFNLESLKRATMKVSYFVLRANQEILERLLQDCAADFSDLFRLEQRAVEANDDDGDSETQVGHVHDDVRLEDDLGLD